MQIDREEFLRYLGWKGQQTDLTLLQKMDRAAQLVLDVASPRSVVRKFALTTNAELAGTGFFLEGNDIRARLRGCDEVYLLAATLGQSVERELEKLQSLSAEAALLFDTAASCAAESYCDDVCLDLQNSSPVLLSERFSCGYGDFPLTAQKDICKLLRTDSRIGLCCDESFLLTPRKSVTAVIGITSVPYFPKTQPAPCRNKCAACKNAGCAFRKTE